MKKTTWLVILISSALFLSACSPKKEQDREAAKNAWKIAPVPETGKPMPIK